MKYLVTGGAGFIGSHLAKKLVRDGHSVVVMDDLSTGRFGNIESLLPFSRFRFVRGSILDNEEVGRLVARADRVFHLAAAVGVMKVFKNPKASFETNVTGAETVLTAAARCGKKVLLTSSSEVYGPHRTPPFREEHAGPEPTFSGRRWFYALSKLRNEADALVLHHEKGLPVVVTRLFNTVGPGQVGDYGMVVPRFVNQALEGKPLTVFGGGAQTRCFAWIGDTVESLVRLMESPGAAGRIVNMGSTEEVSILELAEKVKKMTGSASPIRLIPYERAYGPGFEDVDRRVPDLARLEELIGTIRQTPLAATLTRIIRDRILCMRLERRLSNTRLVFPARTG